jgi:hypothetical protein
MFPCLLPTTCKKQSSPATRHGGAWRERRYSSYSFLTSALDGVSGQRHAPAALCPGERTPGTHCTGGWVGLTVGLDTEVRGKILCPYRGSNPDRPVRSQTLFWLTYSSSSPTLWLTLTVSVIFAWVWNLVSLYGEKSSVELESAGERDKGKFVPGA